MDEYRQVIIDWLYEHPSMSAAQICDWLKEHYEVDYSERTVSRYVRSLREEYDLKKSKPPRDYEAVEELPMGMQLQADFGSKWMISATGVRVKVYFAAYVLAHSRYKYTAFQNLPFTAIDFVNATKSCFQYIGGIPNEIVIDQDSIITVNENYGDIIYTYEFEKFRNEYEFSLYVCRKSDPESKGKVENVVGYVKNNFLENRKYPGDDVALNSQALAWLERTANAKIHGTTKKIPREAWEEEVNYLNPLIITDEYAEEALMRRVRKDNTILFNSNRYSLPLGTYNDHKDVELLISDRILTISTPAGDHLCEHKIAFGSGQLIKNSDHSRDKERNINEVQERIEQLLSGKVDGYLASIRDKHSRYARDQFKLLEKTIDRYGVDQVLKAIEFCENSRLIGATYVRDYLKHNELSSVSTETVAIQTIPVDDPKYHITTQKRSLDVYKEVGARHE